MRLNKILSAAGVASRRTADELIRQGRVTIGGRPVTTLGTQANPETDDIRVDGRRLQAAPARRYLLMYKPRQVMSTRSDPQRRTTVIDLLAAAGITGYFYPVGRLDYDSEGLLVLTNDGEFAERVTHPRYELERTYQVEVEGTPDERDLNRLRRGIVVDGTPTRPATVRFLRVRGGRGGGSTVLEFILREGRNRQVRRMCDAIAHPVIRLQRTRLGTVSDGRLRAGQVRELTAAEVRALTGASASRGSRSGRSPGPRPGARRRPRSRG